MSKFCKDCKYKREEWEFKCMLTEFEEPVSGTRRSHSCEWMRYEIFPFDILMGTCGKRGRFFSAVD